MSKAHRGKGIRELAAHGRGTCPVCGATGIKVLYEAGEQKVKVCKPCRAAIKHGKKSAPVPEAAPAEAAAE
jgi:RNA polymerase subunit RPABC4/transcription elongation factor Spt4